MAPTRPAPPGLRDVRAALLRSDVFIYAIAIDSPERQPINTRVNAEALREITGESGGRTEIVRSSSDLVEATARIAEELNSQYVLGYTSPRGADDKFHSIRVRIRAPGGAEYRVRTRSGYIATPTRRAVIRELISCRLFLSAVVMWSLAAADDRTIDISAHARSIRPGELVVLTVVPPAGSESVQIRAFDRDVPAFRTGDRTWEALVGIDLDVRSRHLRRQRHRRSGPRRSRARRRKAHVPDTAAEGRRGVRHATPIRAGAYRARGGAARGDVEGALARAALERALRPAGRRAGEQRVRHAQHLQRQAAQRARRRRLPQPGRHADSFAERRPGRRRSCPLLFGKHRHHRPRPRTVLDARPPVRDRRARGRARRPRATSSARSARPVASPGRICTGPSAPPTHASIRCRCLAVLGTASP